MRAPCRNCKQASDECGHQGDIPGKIAAIEKVDMATGELYRFLEKNVDGFRLALLPDHATPISVRTHTSEPVPYLFYDSAKPVVSTLKYNEKDAQNGEYLPNGQMITKLLTEGRHA